MMQSVDLSVAKLCPQLSHQTILSASTPPRAFAGFSSAFMVRAPSAPLSMLTPPQVTPVTVHHVQPLHELDVVQEVAWVRNESKQVYLLECLQKTAPPALVLADVRRLTRRGGLASLNLGPHGCGGDIRVPVAQSRERHALGGQQGSARLGRASLTRRPQTRSASHR